MGSNPTLRGGISEGVARPVLEIALLALLGLGLGAFGTLVGTGGGFLLVPILLLLYPRLRPETITSMSLLVVWVITTSGAAAYWWQRRVDVRTGLWFAVAMLPSSVLGALLVSAISRRAFDSIVAVALGAIAVSLLLPRRVDAIRAPVTGRGVVRREITDRAGQTFVYRFLAWQGVALSVGIGFVSSILGIGGGPMMVPTLALVLRFPVHIATATSQFVLAFGAFAATATHAASGTLFEGDVLTRAGAIAVGALIGAQLGARASRRVRGETILRALGLVLLLVSARLALRASG